MSLWNIFISNTFSYDLFFDELFASILLNNRNISCLDYRVVFNFEFFETSLIKRSMKGIGLKFLFWELYKNNAFICAHECFLKISALNSYSVAGESVFYGINKRLALRLTIYSFIFTHNKCSSQYLWLS